MTDQPATLTDYVDQLTRRIHHRERYQVARTNLDGTTTWYGQAHPTTHPPLLEQLEATVEASGAAQEGPRPGFTSKPSARLDALDALARIDHEAARWVRVLGGDDARDDLGHSLPTGTVVRRAAALAGRPCPKYKREVARDNRVTYCCDHHGLERHARSWWIQARVATGWDSPAWRPDNTCPLCGHRGALRVKLADRTGMCLPGTDGGCGEGWDPVSIGLLADHIRAESEQQEDDRAHDAGLPIRRRTSTGGLSACLCRQCSDAPAKAIVLCPDCASGSCPHAMHHELPCAHVGAVSRRTRAV